MKRQVDWFLIIEVVLISILGYITLKSAVITVHGGEIIVKKQMFFLFLGTLGALFFYLYDYRKILDFVPVLYVLTVSVLIITLVVGKVIHGSKSWINLGVFMLQPSEPAKLVAVLTIGYIVKNTRSDYLNLKTVFKLAFAIGVFVVLILIQPDFGTASVYLVMVVVVLFVLGLDRRIIIVLILLSLFGGIVAWNYVFKPYQKNRILTVINPDPKETR